MAESWTKNLLSTVLVSSVINIKEDGAMKVRISWTFPSGKPEQENSSDRKKRVLSQSQPKWWRAGQRIFTPK